MTETRSRRPRRKCAAKKRASSAYYVGYVLDEEPVEMILKKFEQMEAYKAKNKQKDSNSELTEQEMEEVFKRTSSFALPAQSNQKNNAGTYLVGVDGYYDEADYDKKQSTTDQEDFWNDGSRSKKKRRKGNKHTSVKPKVVSMEVIGADGHAYILKKKVKGSVTPQLVTVRIPNFPLPQSWGKNIAPYGLTPAPPKGASTFEANVLDFDYTTLGKDFLAVLMDPPWYLPNVHKESEAYKYITPKDLARVNVRNCISKGFLFIWVEKIYIAELVSLMTEWGFKYVENFCWVKRGANNRFVTQESTYFRRSKLTAIIFRKGEKFELRHQRNCDVIFDFLKTNEDGNETKPMFGYSVVETLLPKAIYQDEENPGRMLKLWGSKGESRQGWTIAVPETIKKLVVDHIHVPCEDTLQDDQQSGQTQIFKKPKLMPTTTLM